MESVYEPERFKASNVINLKEYFTEFKNMIVDELEDFEDYDEKHEDPPIMGVKSESARMKELEETCSLDNLLCEGEVKLVKPEPINHNLRTLVFENLPFSQKYLGLEVLKTKADIELNKNCEQLLLTHKENFHHCVLDKNVEETLHIDLSPGGDFVMNIVFYKPFRFEYMKKNRSANVRFSHEIQMLGKNTLTELRDKIVCSSDSGLQMEVDGTNAELSHLLNAKEEYPSGLFLINEVLYDDMRSPKAVEYSKEIIEWGRIRNITEFIKADMHTTKLEDLSLRFGYPYVYIHQGDCEHIMVFSDAHILTSNDCLNSKLYPRLYSLNRVYSIVCFICNNDVSKWLVKDYDRLPQGNTYLCTKCAKNYCSKDGEKLGKYKIYPIFNIS